MVLYCCVYALFFFSEDYVVFLFSVRQVSVVLSSLFFIRSISVILSMLFFSSSFPLFRSFAFFSLSSLCLVFFLSVFFLRDTATSNGLRRSTFRRFLYLREKIKRKNFDYRREKLFLRYVNSKILIVSAVLKSHKFESLFCGHLFRVFFRLSDAFTDTIGV